MVAALMDRTMFCTIFSMELLATSSSAKPNAYVLTVRGAVDVPAWLVICWLEAALTRSVAGAA